VVAGQERTAVLVVRAWIEEGQLRARITYTRDIGSTNMVETAAAAPEEVVQAVESWLRSFVADE
jgi:hypothetical protein